MNQPTAQSLKTAQALEQLVEKAITDFEFGLNVLRIPDSVREPMWDAIARRASMKALKCSGKLSP